MMSPRLALLLALLYSLSSGHGLAGEAMEVPQAPPTPTIPEADETLPEVRPTPAGLPALQMAPDFISPGLAFGGYFPTAQMESGAIRVEPFTIRAAINAGLGYDDNVTLVRTNKISSMFLTVAPAVVVGLEGASQRYYAVYRGNYGQYFSSSADNYDDHSLGVVASNDWTARFRTEAAYEFTRGHDPRGSTDAATTQPDEWSLHRWRASASYGAPGAPGRVEANLGYLTREYTSNLALVSGRDYEQFDMAGTFYYRAAPKTNALIQIVHSEISHETNALLDASENRYLVGVTWDALAKTQGTARVGYLTRETSNPAAPDFSGATYELGITWAPLTYSVFNLSATRSSAEAVVAGSNFMVIDVATATWNHAWFDRFRSTVRYLYGRQAHEGLDRTDTYNTFGARISYALNRRLRLGAEFRHDARNSPDTTIEYRRNITLVTVESSL